METPLTLKNTKTEEEIVQMLTENFETSCNLQNLWENVASLVARNPNMVTIEGMNRWLTYAMMFVSVPDLIHTPSFLPQFLKDKVAQYQFDHMTRRMQWILKNIKGTQQEKDTYKKYNDLKAISSTIVYFLDEDPDKAFSSAYEQYTEIPIQIPFEEDFSYA